LRKSGNFADLEAIDLGSHDQRGGNRTNGTEGDRMSRTDGNGQYVLIGTYIAFRDTNETKWRLNRIESNIQKCMIFVLIGEFEHLWQIEEFITHHPS